jgi:hypothetical protein
MESTSPGLTGSTSPGVGGQTHEPAEDSLGAWAPGCDARIRSPGPLAELAKMEIQNDARIRKEIRDWGLIRDRRHRVEPLARAGRVDPPSAHSEILLVSTLPVYHPCVLAHSIGNFLAGRRGIFQNRQIFSKRPTWAARESRWVEESVMAAAQMA